MPQIRIGRQARGGVKVRKDTQQTIAPSYPNLKDISHPLRSGHSPVCSTSWPRPAVHERLQTVHAVEQLRGRKRRRRHIDEDPHVERRRHLLGSGSGLGHMFTVGLRQPAPRGAGLAPSISARASFQRASYRIVGSIVHLHCSYIAHSMWCSGQIAYHTVQRVDGIAGRGHTPSRRAPRAPPARRASRARPWRSR